MLGGKDVPIVPGAVHAHVVGIAPDLLSLILSS